MNGIIIINKPAGLTSQQVVSKVKRELNIKKAGHTGTLDPLATGVLPILIGDATKISKYLIEHDKTYIATLKLGEQRETGDLEGEVIATSDKKIISKSEVKEVLKSFLGKQTQIPPKYSAIKIDGKKLYEYARNGEDVEIPSREIEIYKIDLINFDIENQEIKFEVSCSKGTYIRTLCEDIALKLGTVGFMKELKRTKAGIFDIKDSVTFEDLENKNFKIIEVQEVFKDFENIILNERKLELFLNGVKLTFDKIDGVYNIYSESQEYIGLGVIKENLLKRDIVLKSN